MSLSPPPSTLGKDSARSAPGCFFFFFFFFFVLRLFLPPLFFLEKGRWLPLSHAPAMAMKHICPFFHGPH